MRSLSRYKFDLESQVHVKEWMPIFMIAVTNNGIGRWDPHGEVAHSGLIKRENGDAVTENIFKTAQMQN